MKNQKKYYLGLDIGTNSVGYAVTDEEYNLVKFHGEPAWGVMVFDSAGQSSERRMYRTARRRLARRKQRVQLISELFAEEISKVDPSFLKRLSESRLFREAAESDFTLFNDSGFTDKEYHSQYPTIHHLICELMSDKSAHDVRLVYLACIWLVAHRGHFLSNLDREHLSDCKEFSSVYQEFINFFSNNGYDSPWKDENIENIGEILRVKDGVTSKYKKLVTELFGTLKPSKEAREDFPFNTDAIVRLLAGGTVKLKDLFFNEAYDELGSVCLGMDEDKLGEIMASMGEDYDLIASMRKLYDWSVLVEVLGDEETISMAKVNIYEQHKKDLAALKTVIKKYCPDRYDDVFRKLDKDNYAAYVYHTNPGDDASKLKKKNKEDFSKFILSVIKDIVPQKTDEAVLNDMKARLELRSFLPKQKDTDNRVIPYQLYWYELKQILENAASYLPFLNEKDLEGYIVKEKVLSVMSFRIPYFVGPLNQHSDYAWIVRKQGKIYPWNFEDMVDLDASEESFIRKLTNKCTYLPEEDVLPKDSLCYHRYMVLNEINNIKVNGRKIPVELKQRIYNELFLARKKVTRKQIIDFLICNGVIGKDEKELVGGLDEEIKANLIPQISFRRLMEAGILNEEDVEEIIKRASYAEEKTRLAKWLTKRYPQISEEDRKYICNLKIKEFGRLSRKFLCELEGVEKASGELTTIIGALWETNNNLMELLSDRYTFREKLDELSGEYYSEKNLKLEEKLERMYVPSAVRRPIYRTFDIIKDIEKAFGKPEKIFIEMARGGDPVLKGKRTKTRKQQILELYEKCKDEDVRLLKQQLEAMGEYAENKLQSDKLFLYYMQLGRSMYSWEPIEIEKLGATKEYDIDHIYPQAYVKDDSIINNEVLVLSKENGSKSDIYPISADIRAKMRPYWEHLKAAGLLSEEKFRRLTRSTPFTAEEKMGFISRQLTETTQSTKAIADLLKEHFPESEIVYCKAKLASEFRHEFDLYKARTFNDLHHAADAYLNVVTGNVYQAKFLSKWFDPEREYSVKTKTVFTHPVKCGNRQVWSGTEMLEKVKKTAEKNNAHFTKYKFFKKGGLFDQMPVTASENLVPLKKGMPTELYGGYNKPGVMCFLPVRYTAGKKKELFIMTVELLQGSQVLKSEDEMRAYSLRHLSSILKKEVNDVEFPLGFRPWKVNTVLSLDGFKVCITASASGGKCLSVQPIIQFSADAFWKYYIKKLEMFVEKSKNNKTYMYDEAFDKINKQDNLRLYELYERKLQHSLYQKRVNSASVENVLMNGKATFESLNMIDQAVTLLNIHQVFCRATGGVDLTLIKGSKNIGATVNFSTTVSNWAKKYKKVVIVDESPSGLWRKESQNLLELL